MTSIPLVKYSLIIFGLFMFVYIFRWWSLVPIGIVIAIPIVRWIADIFWRGKDDGKW